MNRNRNERHRRQLADWLHEWTIDQHLAETESEDVTGPALRASGDAEAFYARQPACEGDVVLAKPRTEAVGGQQGPVYFLVLAMQGAVPMRWIPFGRYVMPATPDEWCTGLQAVPLHVLCLWNARAVDKGREPAHWWVKRMTARRLMRVQEALQWVKGETGSCPRGMAAKIGPPLVHPGDPRHTYREQERERVDQALGVREEACRLDEDEPPRYLSEPVPGPAQWLQAAEGRERYGISGGTYVSQDGRIVVIAYASTEAGQVRIRIIQRDGTPCPEAEGGHLETGAGSQSETINDGIAFASAPLATQWAALVGGSGQRFPLKRP